MAADEPGDQGAGGGGPKDDGARGGLFQRRYREVTISSIIFGVVVGAIMNAAITYAGLKIGFTIVGSAIAAVLGFGVLRGVLRRGSILEVNIGQTIASAVNTPNSGVIFTVPVLFLIGVPLVLDDGVTPNANFWLLTLACVAGAVLGCAFIVPLRKQMLDIERLRFPSATAVGAILKSPGAGAQKSIVLAIGIIVSALIAVPAQLPQIRIMAGIDELDALVESEKIGYSDKVRTELIERWITDERVPHEIALHGGILIEQESLRLRGAEPISEVWGEDELPEWMSEEGVELSGLEARQVADMMQSRVDEARAEGFERIANETAAEGQVGQFSLGDYSDDLAKLAFAAAVGDAPWETLRDKKAGWATKPLPGYSDLGLRVGREEDGAYDPVDFPYNGLGTSDPVLTRASDRDRNGRADLLITNDTVDVGRMFGLPPEMQLVFAIAPFALGAGYLTGRPGLFVLAGGVLAYLVLNPVLFNFGFMPETVDAEGAPGFGYGNINRPLGIGLLLGGAMMGVVKSLPAIREAVKSISAVGSTHSGRDELGFKVLVVAVVCAGIFLFASAMFAESKPINQADPISKSRLVKVESVAKANGYAIGFESEETREAWDTLASSERDEYLDSINASKPGLLSALPVPIRALLIALIGAGWIWFAGIIIAQCTGMTDWSPISGMALITVVLVMFLAGVGDQLGAVMIGASLCVAITCAADMMGDLKTGYIVGAQPRRQQIVEMISTGIGPVITMAVLLVIASANMKKFGVPMGQGTDTTAPQAQALQAVITGVQGGDMPYALYTLGAVLGTCLGLGSFAGLGVLVGLSMYLPMVYIATYGIGCIANMVVGKIKGRAWAEEWGVPLAAGFIVGDALLGLGTNLFVLILARGGALMKIIGNVLLLIGLITGSLSAATAYLARTDLPTEKLAGLELGHAAGRGAPADKAALRAKYDAGELSAMAFVRGVERAEPLVNTGGAPQAPAEPDASGEVSGPMPGPLADAQLSVLRDAADVKYVRVKSFDWGRRWPFWWVFLISAAALTVGSLLVRAATKAEVANGGQASADRAPPERALASVIEAVATLRSELAAMGDPHQKLALLVHRIDEIQRGPIQDFVDGGTVLTGRIGLGHFAEVMDRFAAGERQVNRAWSAAADGVLEEAEICIASASPPLEDAQSHLLQELK